MPINVVDGDSYSAPATAEPDCDWPILMDCSPSEAFDADTVTLAKISAAEIMNVASAHQFGVCTSTFMPLPPPPCEVGHQDAWSLVDPKLGGFAGADRFAQFYGTSGCGGCGWYGCGCGSNTKIRLWHTRVIDIVQVIVDGEIVDPSTYWLDGNILHSDTGWPTVQVASRRGTVGTWEITYRHGKPLPTGGQIATGRLACEIAMALSDDDECSLPERTKTYTNHAGLTLGIIDPMEFLVDGMTGLYIPDQWIRRVNPHGLVRRARAYSFKKHRRGAKRVPNPSNLSGGFQAVYTGDTDETVQVRLKGVATLAGATNVEAHVWVDPDDVTVLAGSVVGDPADRVVEIELGDGSGWLANLVQDPGEIVLYNLQVQVTFGADVSTWPPDTLTVIGQAA